MTVLSHPNQHLAPAFRVLDSRAEIDHVVIYGNRQFEDVDPGFGVRVDWDIELLGGYECRVVRDKDSGILRGTWSALNRERPDVVIVHGWGKAIDRAAIVWCLAHRVPFLLTGDTSSHHQFASGRLAIAVRRVVLVTLFRFAAGALTTGTFNRDFYRNHRMRESKLFPGCIPIDSDRFDADQLSKRTTTPNVTFASKLVDFKGGEDLIEALAAIRDARWTATIAGDGPQKDHLMALAEKHALVNRITFEGFVNQSAMPSLLAQADILAVPSWRDNRVLVASEALAAGAAVVASTGTGIWGRGDIVEHGISGLVFRARDIRDLSDSLRLLIENRAERQRLAAAGRERVLSTQTTHAFAENVIRAALTIRGRSPY